MKIDAHQQFWQPARGDYGWMPNDNLTLNRAYAPSDFAPTLDKLGINGTILVQAAVAVQETGYMLGLANATQSIKGVIGCINFEDPGDLAHLSRLA